MDECSFKSIRKRKMIVKDKIDYAEYHDGTDDACSRAVNYFLSVRELSDLVIMFSLVMSVDRLNAILQAALLKFFGPREQRVPFFAGFL